MVTGEDIEKWFYEHLRTSIDDWNFYENPEILWDWVAVQIPNKTPAKEKVKQ